MVPCSMRHCNISPHRLEVARPANGQQIGAEIIGGEELLNVISPLQIHRKRTSFGNVEVNRSRAERPRHGAINRIDPPFLAEAGRAVKVSGKANAEVLYRLGRKPRLPHAVKGLVGKEELETDQGSWPSTQ